VCARDEIPAQLIADQLVAEAMRVTRGPVALYVLDIDGSHLLRLAGRVRSNRALQHGHGGGVRGRPIPGQAADADTQAGRGAAPGVVT
jgi:hypothetical protein